MLFGEYRLLYLRNMGWGVIHALIDSDSRNCLGTNTDHDFIL